MDHLLRAAFLIPGGPADAPLKKRRVVLHHVKGNGESRREKREEENPRLPITQSPRRQEEQPSKRDE